MDINYFVHDNACNETLARFPPTPSPVLVDDTDRCSGLLLLSALPRISSSAIEYMKLKSPLLEDFLRQSLMLECGNGSANNSGIKGNVSSQHEMKFYYQALKLISLCGWKLRSLPYLVDCKDMSVQSVRNTTILDCSHVVADMENNRLIVHSANTDENLKRDENSKDFSGEQMDPNTVVLDCTLCGATVGLWAFCTVPRPVESIRLVGYTEVTGDNDSVTYNLFNRYDLKNRQGVTNTMSDIATSSEYISASLNMTIAGGPAPIKQNFKAIISFPVIGPNLRARLLYGSDFGDIGFVNGIQSDSQKKIRIQEKTDSMVNACIGQIVPTSSEIRGVSDYETGSQASIHDSVVDDVVEGTHYAGEPSSLKDKMPVHREADVLNSLAAGEPRSSQKNLTEGEALTAAQKTLGEVSSHENYGVKDRVENPINSEGKDLRPILSDIAMEFDPIRWRRHFCRWIASIIDGEPGWQQTLSALYHHNNHLLPSSNRSPSSMTIVKVDDPVGSVRKLFMSPSMKRMKLTRISG